MNGIAEADWGFENIRAVDYARAAQLESVGSRDMLASALVQGLEEAIGSDGLRIAIDSIDKLFNNCRAIIQFQVDQRIYDWLFNARTGYRAQFWVSPDAGINFNKKIIEALSKILSQRLPKEVKARRIRIIATNNSRQEEDDGVIIISRAKIISSLLPELSKIWIAERRYDGPEIAEIGFSVLNAAERWLPKLSVPRWEANPVTGVTGEGLRAPLPQAEESWLDLKGAFLDEAGNVSQIKPQDTRAKQIHRCGWT